MQKRSWRIISEITFSVPPSPASASPQRTQCSSFDDVDIDGDGVDLPTYNPLSAAGKREKSRLRSAHNAIHLIPLLVLLCTLVLWLFSYPGESKS